MDLGVDDGVACERIGMSSVRLNGELEVTESLQICMPQMMQCQDEGLAEPSIPPHPRAVRSNS